MTSEEMARRIEQLEISVQAQAKIHADAERAAREKELNQLKWGFRVVGIFALALGSWVWAQIGPTLDFKGD